VLDDAQEADKDGPMSNTVKSWIEVHDGGKLTVEDVNLAVHEEHPVPSDYYSATLEQSGRISVRTKWAAPVGAVAQLAYREGLNVTMEFDSLDNSEIGSMQFYYRRVELEAMDEIGVLDYYRPGQAPRWALEMATKSKEKSDRELAESFGARDAAEGERK
jgi:hypothetical protein